MSITRESTRRERFVINQLREAFAEAFGASVARGVRNGKADDAIAVIMAGGRDVKYRATAEFGPGTCDLIRSFVSKLVTKNRWR